MSSLRYVKTAMFFGNSDKNVTKRLAFEKKIIVIAKSV